MRRKKKKEKGRKREEEGRRRKRRRKKRNIKPIATLTLRESGKKILHVKLELCLIRERPY